MILRPASVRRWSRELSSEQSARLDELHLLGLEVLTTTDDRERLRRWHELLFAVGNMKRSAGNIHPPNSWVGPDLEAGHRPSRVPLPRGISEDGDLVILEVDDPSTWPKLAEIRGLGPATTSMVLASLWPDRHATFDRWTRQVIGAMVWPDGGLEGDPPAVSMQAYSDWYLPSIRHVAAEVGLPLSTVERAVFRFGQKNLAGKSAVVRWDNRRRWKGFRDDIARAFNAL